MIQRSVFRASILPVCLAFIAWGAWAYFINLKSGRHQALVSGITQGIYSGIVTLYMSYSVGFLWKKCRKQWPHSKLSVILPALGTVGHTGLILVCAHWINDTPHIFNTVAAPLTVAALYSFYLTRQLQIQGDKS